jgi:hypothetical protein
VRRDGADENQGSHAQRYAAVGIVDLFHDQAAAPFDALAQPVIGKADHGASDR